MWAKYFVRMKTIRIFAIEIGIRTDACNSTVDMQKSNVFNIKFEL